MHLEEEIADLVCLVYFVALWYGYATYAKSRAWKGDKPSLSREMIRHRRLWCTRILRRDARMTDASLLANQERIVGFFASTTLIILAAILTAIPSVNQIAGLVARVPMVATHSEEELVFKLSVLLLVMVFAFFKITWSLRQYGFASVLVGSAPLPDEELTSEERRRFAENLARLMDRAGHDNNSGLRAYYFAVSVVFWILGDLAFVLATSITVLVLAKREFRSPAVTYIGASQIECG